MKISRMIEGQLYTIKPETVVQTKDRAFIQRSAPHVRVLRGWRCHDHYEEQPPFMYLGWKMEEWTYTYLHTKKIHYVLWQDDMYVMDNQFAKHIIPVWDGDGDGQDR